MNEKSSIARGCGIARTGGSRRECCNTMDGIGYDNSKAIVMAEGDADALAKWGTWSFLLSPTGVLNISLLKNNFGSSLDPVSVRSRARQTTTRF